MKKIKYLFLETINKIEELHGNTKLLGNLYDEVCSIHSRILEEFQSNSEQRNDNQLFSSLLCKIERSLNEDYMKLFSDQRFEIQAQIHDGFWVSKNKFLDELMDAVSENIRNKYGIEYFSLSEKPFLEKTRYDEMEFEFTHTSTPKDFADLIFKWYEKTGKPLLNALDCETNHLSVVRYSESEKKI